VFFLQVWPGISAWPDFLNPETVTWWGQKIGQFLGTVSEGGRETE
jgi:alpha-glucosidase (family GH31 glycosyl hydrolase)